MYPLTPYRNQWLESYYSGDHRMLHFLESDDFFVRDADRVTTKKLRHKHIQHLVKLDQWHPIKLAEKDIIFDQKNEAEYIITGVAYSESIHINFEEKWIVENDRWRIAYLVMGSGQ